MTDVGMVTVAEAAVILGVSPQTVRRAFDAGQYPGGWRTPGGDRRIPRSDLVAQLETRTP